MSVKSTTPDQHNLLHSHWPDDCCLCRVERERDTALSQVAELFETQRERDELRKLCRAVWDDPCVAWLPRELQQRLFNATADRDQQRNRKE